MAQSRWHKTRQMNDERNTAILNRSDILYDLAVRDGGYRCVRCGSRKHLEIDHIEPVSLGGKSELQNMQILCRRCNLFKNDRIIDYRKKG